MFIFLLLCVGKLVGPGRTHWDFGTSEVAGDSRSFFFFYASVLVKLRIVFVHGLWWWDAKRGHRPWHLPGGGCSWHLPCTVYGGSGSACNSMVRDLLDYTGGGSTCASSAVVRCIVHLFLGDVALTTAQLLRGTAGVDGSLLRRASLRRCGREHGMIIGCICSSNWRSLRIGT